MGEKCVVKTWDGWRYSPCNNNAKLDGWCLIHHPERKKRKAEERYLQRQRKNEIETQRRNAPYEHIKYLEGLLDNQCIEFKRWE